MADVGKKTGKKTQAGRDVYKTPEGELVSEKSTTFKYKGKWVNVPTIFDGKSYDEETLILMLEADIIKPTSVHNSLKEATEAARKRSDSLKFNEGGMADQTRKFYEDNVGNPEAIAEAYGVDLVDPDETLESAKAVGQFALESLPGVGTAFTVADIEDELKKEEPNYVKIGMLVGTEAIGLIPGLGTAAKNMIRKGADMARQTDEVMDVASSIPKVSRKSTPTYTDAELLEADEIISEWGKGNLTNPELRSKLREKGFTIETKRISPKMTGDDLEVVGPDGNIVRWKDMPRGRVNREADAVEAARLRNDPDALEQWRKDKKLPETQRQKNLPDAQAAAQSLIEGKITSKEARKRIQEAFPEPKEYTAEEVMNLLPTLTEVQGALGKKGTRYPILGVEGADLAEGQVVSSRLDIPAYDDYDKWVVSIHDGNQKSGSVVGYGQAIRLKNIRFGSDADTALDIARGTRTDRKTLQDAIDKKTGGPAKQNKATIARIFGEYTSEDPYDLQRQAAEIIASGSDEWTQVGMNPYRGSGFYDKKTGKPVFEADEIIQVGPLVLAKNVKKPTVSQMKEMGVRTQDGKIRMFNEGGTAMNMQKQMSLFEYGGIADDGMKKDPVSGNDIPPGSLASEVRDDIPAMLSEGEYVVPADVLRYYGVNFFEDLRNKAKTGLSSMEQNGRIGGEPLSPQQIQQNMSGAPQAGAPAPMPVQANQGVLTMPKEYTQQSQMLGAGGFNPADWATVGGSTFNQTSQQDSVTTFKTFVNSDTNQSKVIEYINGKLKNPSDEQYTVPPYYEFGTAALKKAQQATQQPTGGDDGGGTPPPTTPTSDTSLISAFDDMDLSSPLAAAEAMMANATNLGGGAGAALAASVAGPAGMGFMGLAQSGNALTNISNLNALSILAQAQGKTDDAKTIAKMADDLSGKSNLITQALDDIVATGNQKAGQLIDKYGLRATRDPKTGRFTFSQDDIKYNRSYLSTYTLARQNETEAILQGGGATGDDDGPTVTTGGGTRARDPNSGPSTGESTFTGPKGDKYTFDSEDMTTEEEAENDAIFDAIDAQFESAGVSQNKGGLMARKKANKK
jgi:hypothetical protein